MYLPQNYCLSKELFADSNRLEFDDWSDCAWGDLREPTDGVKNSLLTFEAFRLFG